MIEGKNPGTPIDRLIIHQHDPRVPVPGGIDTCLRGLAKYSQESGGTFAIVGVDARGAKDERPLGVWDRIDTATGGYWFLPVCRLDPADQKRKIPHSLRLMMGVWRYRRRLPKAKRLQAHRMDVALASRMILRRPYFYFVHTQETGLTGRSSDSLWRWAGRAHHALERRVIKEADLVVVFNDDFGRSARLLNPKTVISPTWFDPDLIQSRSKDIREVNRIVWVGRLERPKDPLLALRAFVALAALPGGQHYELRMIGSGTLAETVRDFVSRLPEDIACRTVLHGRLDHSEVLEQMANADVFLMTSQPGYEGYPRVLVEALASGLPAVVTQGSDTGGLVTERSGSVVGREEGALARAILEVIDLDSSDISDSVAELSAPSVISRIYDQFR